ncbi:MAG: YVTN family beta-propeller protein [Myxococcota bacterium]|jgi:YVTN family beta-propeller protein
MRRTPVLVLSTLVSLVGCAEEVAPVDVPAPPMCSESGNSGQWSTLSAEGNLDLNSKQPPPIQSLSDSASIPAWTFGRAMARRGSDLLVVDTGNGTLVTIDTVSMTPTKVVPIGRRPEQVVVGPDVAWVTVRTDGLLARVSGDTVETVPVGLAPIGLALNVAGDTVWVALSG